MLPMEEIPFVSTLNVAFDLSTGAILAPARSAIVTRSFEKVRVTIPHQEAQQYQLMAR